MKNYYDLLKKYAALTPQKIFLQFEDRAYSYLEFKEYVDRLAAAVSLPAPAAVLAWGEGIKEQAGAFFALQKCGLLPILMHHDFSEADMLQIIRQSSLQALWQLKGEAGSWIKSDLPFAPHAEADIMGALTSGSTGLPKVLYRTFFSWAGFFAEQNKIFHIDSETTMFIHGSLSFTGNLNLFVSVLSEGGTLICGERLSGRSWRTLLEKHRANSLYLVPTKLQLLAARSREPFDGLRTIITGSQLLTAQNIRRLQTAFPKMELILYYGATELNYITYAVCNDPDRDSANLGRPFPGIGVSIKDGAIYVDTPYHVSGVEIPFTCKDGGCLNENGELIFTGRLDYVINRSGYKVNSLKVENTIKAQSGVADAVVLPYEDELRGAKIAAFVVLSSVTGTEAASEAECTKAIHKALHPQEIPNDIIFVKKIPLNDRGKPDKGKLKNLLK